MRVIYMGTPDFAVPALQYLAKNTHHDIAYVVTAEDKPQGRGRNLQPPVIKTRAQYLNIPVLQPQNLKDPTFLEKIRSAHPDILVVVAFRILPVELFTIPRYGAINLHASLLPYYRGPAPIQWAIMNGDKITGVTTFQIDAGIDTGKVLLQKKILIRDDETAGELAERLAKTGAQAVADTLGGMEAQTLKPVIQVEIESSHAPKITRENQPVVWSEPAYTIVNKIRALSPSPGAWTYYENTLLKLFRARSVESPGQKATPGSIIKANPNEGLFVQTGDCVVEILIVQREGKKILTAIELLRGTNIEEGHVLQSTVAKC